MTRSLLLLSLLTGCALVDQTAFNAQAGKRPELIRPPPTPPAPPAPDPAALLTVHYPYTGDLGADVARAVAAARARKPGVAFEVLQITPAAPDANPGAEAGQVARLITAQGVPASRVRLTLRPGGGREVRVYVH